MRHQIHYPEYIDVLPLESCSNVLPLLSDNRLPGSGGRATGHRRKSRPEPQIPSSTVRRRDHRKGARRSGFIDEPDCLLLADKMLIFLGSPVLPRSREEVEFVFEDEDTSVGGLTFFI